MIRALRGSTVQLRIFTEPQQGADYDTLLAVAKATEELGFDAFFRSDHYLRIGAGDPGPGPTDAWATLAALARETERVRLGTLVSSATFRLPGPLAVTAAQVDRMSGGRLELGLGTGWYEAEHVTHGIPFPPVGERFERLEEQLEILTGLWRTPDGERFSFRGRHYALEGCPPLPRPAQRPHPPIILGGAGPRRTPRLAARFADEFNVAFRSVEETGAQFERVRDACREAGRDPAELTLSVAQTVCCGRDEDELERRAAAIGQDRDRLVRGLAGRPDQVVGRLQVFGALGATRVYLQVLDLHDLDHLELLAAEVLPRVP